MGIFHTHFVLPLADPDRHAGLAGRLRQIRKFERMSLPEQRVAQHLRLQRLIVHAYVTVPFYRKQFDDAGVHPSQIQPGQPIPIPVTTQDILQNQPQSLISAAYRQEGLCLSSSGSLSTNPNSLGNDVNGLRDKAALGIELNAWAGYLPGDSVMMLPGAHSDLTEETSWKRRLCDNVLLRRTSVALGNLSEEDLERCRLGYEMQRPKVLYGNSTVLARFAGYLAAHGIRHRPRVVIATAEAMSDDHRSSIESIFNIKLFMHYRNEEMGGIAAECPDHEGLHFHPWGACVEFDPVCDTPEGSVYRLLITDLLNYGQPLIRYDTGDCVTLTAQMCSCGRWFPLARHILCREREAQQLHEPRVRAS